MLLLSPLHTKWYELCARCCTVQELCKSSVCLNDRINIADRPFCCCFFQEATAAIKPILGAYYSQDKRNVMSALWEEVSTCHWVAPEQQGSGVLWFKTTGKDEYIRANSKQE